MLKDGLKTNKFVHIELNDEGHWHCDSVNPKTGGQLGIHETFEAWLCLGHLIVLSPEYHKMPDGLTEEQQEKWQSYHDLSVRLAGRIAMALETVVPGYFKRASMSNVGIRETWEK